MTKPKKYSTIKVAVAQYGPMTDSYKVNLDMSINALSICANKGAELVVLPELCTTQYIMPSLDDYNKFAEDIEGASLTEWKRMAADLNLHIVAGFLEMARGLLYNSAALISPQGLVGVYRKSHLWEYEHQVFAPGDTGFMVWGTDLGRIGILICFDLRFPESARVLALRGADIICAPTAWNTMINRDPFDAHGYLQGTYLSMAHANVNRVSLACANRVGLEGAYNFVGKSIIVDAMGKLDSGPADATAESFLISEITPMDSRNKSYGKQSDLFEDRRPDLYEALLETKELGNNNFKIST